MDSFSGMLGQELDQLKRDLLVSSALGGAGDMFIPIVWAVQDHVPSSKKRGPFLLHASAKCERWLLERARGAEIIISKETGRRLFHRQALSDWMKAEGAALCAAHRVMFAGGQAALPLPNSGSGEPA